MLHAEGYHPSQVIKTSRDLAVLALSSVGDTGFVAVLPGLLHPTPRIAFSTTAGLDQRRGHIWTPDRPVTQFTGLLPTPPELPRTGRLGVWSEGTLRCTFMVLYR